MTRSLQNIPGGHRESVLIPSGTSASASDAVIIHKPAFAEEIEGVQIVPDAAMTGETTGTTQFKVVSYNTPGGSGTTRGLFNGNTGDDLALATAVELASGADFELPKAGALTLERNKIGSGAAFPGMLVSIDFHPASAQ